MSEFENIGDPFSADTIRLYLEGKLSAEQMHALEKAALEDPFLSDAIEGMQIRMQLKEGSFVADTGDLKQRLQARVQERDRRNKIIPLPMSWRGAAAILLLGGSIFLSYRFLIGDRTAIRPIAITENKKEVMKPDADSVPVKVQDVPGSVENKAVTQSTTKASSKANTKKQTMPVAIPAEDVVGAKESDQKRREQPTFEKDDQREVKANKQVAKPDSTLPVASGSLKPGAASEGRVAGLSIQAAPTAGLYIFRGRVIDQRRRPVMGASVGFQNKKVATVTDEQGRFRLKTDKPDSNAVVVVHSLGYQPASYMLSSDSSDNLVQLTPSSASLKEAVVAGYNTKKKADSLDDEEYDKMPGKNKIRVEKAIPANGWNEYENYLTRNKKIRTGDSVLSGNEIVSFNVDTNGRLSDFKIEKSLSLAHDAEAIRLLREGPAWKLLRGNKQRTTITINF